jgi:copper transport protein
VRARAGALAIALLCALTLLLGPAGKAWAHASLVRAEPADGAVLSGPPAALVLTFNEPVAPLVVRLIGPDGAPVAFGAVAGENTTVTVPVPASLARGSHVLSWRVISADGHPVGGALTFSIGAPSVAPVAGEVTDRAVRIGLWAARVVLYLGLFLGIGGAFFRAWLVDARPPAVPWIVALLIGGLIAVPISVGLQGLDALDLPLAGLKQRIAWQTGLETSYGRTAIVAATALFAGLLAMAARSVAVSRALSLAGLLGVGLALALSGHASTAEPRPFSAVAVFVHAVCVALWIGALLPLYAGVHAAPQASTELRRFSRVIPLPLLLLLVSGLWLAFVQVDRVEALWTTPYGQVLSCKLLAVLALLGLGAVNRYRLVPRYQAKGAAAARAFARVLAIELTIALAILALVALWRFTPPPRALAEPAAVSIHIHGDKAMAEIAIARAGGQGARADLLVLDGEFRPLAAKEVTLVLANPAAGIEPMRRAASHAGENLWQVEDLHIPVAGRWLLRVEILISDFDKLTVEDTVTLPRTP